MESGAAQRKAIGEITDLSEARAEIERARAETAESERKRLLHPLTEMPNLSAYNEAPRKAYQGEVDADSLKWWNDEFANEAGDAGGDALLKNVGQALQKAGLEAYHIKGDEFVAQGDDPHELAARLELANRILEGSTVQFETLGGETRSFTGAQMTYGVGETLAKGNPYGKANAELKRLKLEKEASGERAARGERPPGVVEVGAKAGPPQGKQELAGRPASGQPDRGVEEGAGAGVKSSEALVKTNAASSLPARVKTKAPEFKSYQEAQDAIDDYETRLEKQHGEKSIMPSGKHLLPVADRERLDAMYAERDRIGEADDKAALDAAMAQLRPESKNGVVKEADVRAALEDLQKSENLTQAFGKSRTRGREVLVRQLMADLSHKAVDARELPDVFRGSPETILEGVTHWRQMGLGRSPEPFVDQINSIVDDLLGTAPPPKEKAAEKTPQRQLPPAGEASLNASDLHANPKRGEMPVRFTETEIGVPLAVTDKLAAALDKHPKAEVLARYIEENAPRLKAVIDKVIQKALSPEEAARVEQSGLGLLEWNGPAFGANFYDSGNPAGPVAIYVNPFRTEEQVVSRTWYPSRSGGDNPRKLAQDFVNTALHEAAHNLERQEGESHWQVMDRLYDAAGGERTFNPLVEEVQDVITQGNPGGELSPEYRAGRQVYLEATRSAGSARSTDVLRPTAGGRQAPGANLARRVSKGQSVPGQPGRGNSGGPKVAPIRTGTEVDRIFDEGYVPPKARMRTRPTRWSCSSTRSRVSSPTSPRPPSISS
jgi:GGDEF domain-containing protein